MKENVRFWYLWAAMLSQCIMKIPGVFVNIASGAIQRPDGELTEETARTFVVCLHMPGPRQSIKCRHRWAELAWLNAALPDALWSSLFNFVQKAYAVWIPSNKKLYKMVWSIKVRPFGFLATKDGAKWKKSIKCRHRWAELAWLNAALPDALWNSLFKFVHKNEIG